MASTAMALRTNARASKTATRLSGNETTSIRTEEDAHANCRRYKQTTRAFVYFMLSTTEAETCRSMLHRAVPLTLVNAKCWSGELEEIAEKLHHSRVEIPDEVVDTLVVTIHLRKLQARYYASQPNSCPIENDRHRHFIDVLVLVYNRITGRIWQDMPTAPRRTSGRAISGVDRVLNSSSSSKSPGNRYSILTTIKVDVVEGGWSCLRPLGIAQQELMDLLQGGLTGHRNVDEMAVCMNQGMRHLRTLGFELRSVYPGMRTVSDVEDTIVLNKLSGFLSEKHGKQKDSIQLGPPHNLEAVIMECLREFVMELSIPELKENTQLQMYLNLDTFYTEAKSAVEKEQVPAWFLWAMEPYLRMRTFLAIPNSLPFTARLALMLEIETDSQAFMTANSECLDESIERTLLYSALTAAKQYRLNTALLGRSTHKYPFSASLQSFSAMLYRREAGMMYCSNGGPVGLTAILYVACVMFDLFPDDPSHEEGYVNQWNDMETIFDTHVTDLRARVNMPKPLNRDDYASKVDHEAAELESEAIFRSQVVSAFHEWFPALEGQTQFGVWRKERIPLSNRNDLENDLSWQQDLSASNIGPSCDESVSQDGFENFTDYFSELYQDSCLDYVSFGVSCKHFLLDLCQRIKSRPTPWEVVSQTLSQTASLEKAHPLKQLPVGCRLVDMSKEIVKHKSLIGDCMMDKATAWREQMLYRKMGM